MIILKTKTFGDKKDGRNRGRGGNNGKPKIVQQEKLAELSEEEKAAKRLSDLRKRRRGSRQERMLAREQSKVDKVDLQIETLKKRDELKNKLEKLSHMKHPELAPPPPDTRNKAQKLRDKIVENLSDSKTKKNLKTAGLITLGTGAAAGIVAGGIKLKKKLDQKRSNKKIKESLIEEKDDNTKD